MRKYIILPLFFIIFNLKALAQEVYYDQLYRADYSWMYTLNKHSEKYEDEEPINRRLNVRFTKTQVRIDDSADGKKYVYKIDKVETENDGKKIIVQANNYRSKFILFWGQSKRGDYGWFLTWYWGGENEKYFKYKQEMSILHKVYY